MIRLLHLSDIHFSKRSNTHYDLDKHTRDMLLEDLATQLDQGKLTGCLVTGDIAFSGNENEYGPALEFFTLLSRSLNFPLGSIWVVPGNHDYSRKVAGDSLIVQDLAKQFRRIDETEINKQIEAYSTSEEHKGKLYGPLEAFNNFAKQFNCEITAEKTFWDAQIPISESQNIFLYIRGLNSVLISSPEDDEKNDQTRMIMSLRQCQQGTKNDGVRMSLCHHPNSWLRNAKEIQTQLGNSFDIQLYGHEHQPRIDRVNDSLLIHAGAVHPEKGERAAVPCYNILELTACKDGESEKVDLKVISRYFDFRDGRYKTIEPKKGAGHLYSFPISKHRPQGAAPQSNQPNPLFTAPSQQIKLDEQLAVRTLQVHFYSLSFYQQIGILQALDLIKDADSEQLEKKHFGPFFHRARDQGLLETMWDRILDKTPLAKNCINPFRKV